MTMRFIRLILPLLVVLTIVIAFALVATGTITADAAGMIPGKSFPW